MVDRLLDHPFGTGRVRDVVAVGDGLAPGGEDLADDLLGRCAVRTGTVRPATQVVDHDLRTLRGEEQGMFAAYAAASSGDDGNASLQRSHAGAS
jgi:hypothetical protein